MDHQVLKLIGVFPNYWVVYIGLWCLIPPLGNHKLIDQVCTAGRPFGAAPTSSRVDLDKLSVAILLVVGYSRSSQMPVNDDWVYWRLGSMVA